MKTALNRGLGGLLCGFVFGLGLAVSQMTDPEKVTSFLMVGAGWDPSLLLVMAAALAVTFVGYRYQRSDEPLFDTTFHLPTARNVELRLVGGAAIFGVGWGLAGYCPGPAITDLGARSLEPVIFIAAFVVGSQLGVWLAPPARTLPEAS